MSSRVKRNTALAIDMAAVAN